VHHLIRETVGLQCVNPKCIHRLQRIDSGERCEHCGERLVSKNVTNWRFVGPSLALLAVLLGAGLYLTKTLLDRRQAALAEEQITEATHQFQKNLLGVTASDVEAVADVIQAELKLTDEQLHLVLERSQESIDKLPRGLTPDVEEPLETLVRHVYRDGRITSQERKELDAFARRERLAPATMTVFEDRFRSRVDTAHQRLARGKELLREQRYAEARMEILSATQSDPGDAVSWANLGVVSMAMGRPDEARESYSKALRLDPENWVAHYNLGLLSERGGDREAAFRHFRQALAAFGPSAARERKAVVDDLLREPSLSGLRQDARFSDLFTPAALRGQG
jgi:tetratricopeptide (TPR) repeat protein